MTTVPRTILDLAAVLPRGQVERAIEEAEVRRLADPLSLLDLVTRYPGKRGVGTLKAILKQGGIGATATRSELENRFLTFLDHHDLPRPEVNAHVDLGGRLIECDCVWRKQRLIVELDGHAFHATTAAYERDRARDRTLHAAGWRVVRITWRELHGNTRALADDLTTLLSNETATPIALPS